MFCPNCGKKTASPTAKFCRFCGASLVDPDSIGVKDTPSQQQPSANDIPSQPRADAPTPGQLPAQQPTTNDVPSQPPTDADTFGRLPPQRPTTKDVPSQPLTDARTSGQLPPQQQATKETTSPRPRRSAFNFDRPAQWLVLALVALLFLFALLFLINRPSPGVVPPPTQVAVAKPAPTSVPTTASKAQQPPKAAPGPQGYLASEGVPSVIGADVLFIQWTEVGGSISGTMYFGIVSSQSSKTDNSAITGLRNGSNVSISLPTFAGRSSLQGTIEGDTLTLMVQDTGSGQVVSFKMQAATIDDYNNVLTAMQQGRSGAGVPQPPPQAATPKSASAAPTRATDMPRGYIAHRYLDGSPGVFFMQWTETNNQLVGDFRGISKPDGELGVSRIIGTRNGSTVNLVMGGEDRWSHYSIEIQGNSLTLQATDPQAKQHPAWVFQAASVAEYYNGVDAFVQSRGQFGSETDGLQGYIADRAPGGERGVFFVQWTEVNGTMMGDFRLVGNFTPSDPNLIGAQIQRVEGTRSGTTVNLSSIAWPGPRKYSGTIQGNSLTLRPADASSGQTLSWPLRRASEAEYNQALADFSRSERLLTLFPLKKNLTETGDGWQRLTIDLGIRNDGPVPYPVPNPSKGSVDIAGGGASYDVGFSAVSGNSKGLVFGFSALPPGFALCGIAVYNQYVRGVAVLQAEGRIPQKQEPATLIVPGYLRSDISDSRSTDDCHPRNLEQLPRLPMDIPLGSKQTPDALFRIKNVNPSAASNLTPPLKLAVVQVEIQSMNRLGDFTVPNFLGLAIIDDDGIARFQISDSGVGGLCDLTLSGAKVGPSQTRQFNLCYLSRPNQMVAFVVSSPESYTIVRPEADSGGPPVSPGTK